MDRAYLDALCGVTLTDDRVVRLVYTPLHGTGGRAVLAGLEKAGFRDVHVVEAQSDPDGDFPNVADHIPNPEVPAALREARALAEETDADLALATDPDADRLGCVVKRVLNGRPEWVPLNGNQIGSLLCYFVLNELQQQGRLPSDGLVVKTAVTTDLVNRIADHFRVGRVSELLVGFKYIGCVIKHLHDPARFLFGLEESHGYLSGAYTRDKDGANAALLLAEAAAKVKREGKDLWWLLNRVYRQFGYFAELLENYRLPGRSGQLEIQAMMRSLRERPPETLAGLRVTRIVDRLTEQVRDLEGGALLPMEPLKDPKTGEPFEQLKLAKDNLIILHLGGKGMADGGKVAVRPSGTEPKCKFYISLYGPMGGSQTDPALEAGKRGLEDLAMGVRGDILEKVTGGV